jgi:2-oxoglutarate dehydrogenase E1 component
MLNFNLVKWRLASLKAYSASASGSSTRAKRRGRRNTNGFDKDLFNN